MVMKTSELEYVLPQELIAQRPCEKRDESRMLVLDRKTQTIREDLFRNVAFYLRRGDCMVLNDTRVIRARVYGHKPTGGRVELLLLHEEVPGTWSALVRPSARVKPGTAVQLAGGLVATAGEVLPNGRRRVHFDFPDVVRRLEEIGEIPLPPYIRREHPDESDGSRYQTIYAHAPGAVAAPTAGLHFTDAVFESLDEAGVLRRNLTLHVGYGTFRPIMTEDLNEHTVEPEEFEFPLETACALNAVRAEGARVVAVGTTVTRVLETQHAHGVFRPGLGRTDCYIRPPHAFQGVDVLQTNFHLPRSSLLALVCAFAGTQFVLEAYRYAVEQGFRFYSYGDVMLIL